MFFAGLAAAAALVASQPAQTELVISFPQLQPRGQVSVAVFASAAGWKRRAEPVWARVAKVEGASLKLQATLPPGSYAVMAYHDRNGNGRLDTLPGGLPIEPYGFSNDSRGVMGPPSWAAAVFTLSPTGGMQTIRLR